MIDGQLRFTSLYTWQVIYACSVFSASAHTPNFKGWNSQVAEQIFVYSGESEMLYKWSGGSNTNHCLPSRWVDSRAFLTCAQLWFDVFSAFSTIVSFEYIKTFYSFIVQRNFGIPLENNKSHQIQILLLIFPFSLKIFWRMIIKYRFNIVSAWTARSSYKKFIKTKF